jgi:hypothetical protein
VDLAERHRRVIRALERHGHEQGNDGNWQCAHPDHEDVHPSMSVIMDKTTGIISFKCWSRCPGAGDPDRKQWVEECLKALGLRWSVLFPNRRPPDGHEPPF